MTKPATETQDQTVDLSEVKKLSSTAEDEPAVEKRFSISQLGQRKKIILGILASLAVLLLSGSIFGALAVRSLWQEKAPLERDVAALKAAAAEQDLAKIDQGASVLEDDLNRLKTKIDGYWLAGKLPIVKNYYHDAQHGINAGLATLSAADLVVEAITPYADILGLGEEKTATAEGKTALDRVTFLVTTLDKIRPQLDKIGQELEVARKEMDQINPSRYPEEFRGLKVRKNLTLAIETLDQFSSLVNDAKPLLEVAPELMGVSAPQQYFVLFQNDAELRPTGGFMTAYGILKVDKGKITPILSEDIYSLDAAFRKRLPAPEPIKRFHKNVPYFYLRDMNLSPDFAESMKLFMEHYNHNVAGAREVDGVIAVDTQLLVSLVEILGPIGVPEWGTFSAETDKRCDCPQIVYRLEEIADKPVSEIRTSRKAVIGPLMHSILANVFNSPKTKIAELFNVGLTGVQEKHVLFYLFDEKAQAAVEAFNLAGRVRETDADTDYQLLVDTNFAGAKSNLFIRQNIKEKIEIAGDGTVTKSIEVIYNNPHPPSDCGLLSGGLCLNGLYRNWFRLYVPRGSQLLEMTGSEIQAETYEELGKTVFEGFFGDKYPLRPQSNTKVTFKYQLPFKVKKGEEYRLLIQKQAGVEKYEMEIDFNGQKQELELRGDKELRWQL